ncbi:hypothetical protein ACWBE0_005207, partial [Escherichia coli]
LSNEKYYFGESTTNALFSNLPQPSAKDNQNRRKNPPIWQGGVNEDMAIVSFVCFMCCSLQRQKFAAVMREKQS